MPQSLREAAGAALLSAAAAATLLLPAAPALAVSGGGGELFIEQAMAAGLYRASSGNRELRVTSYCWVAAADGCCCRPHLPNGQWPHLP